MTVKMLNDGLHPSTVQADVGVGLSACCPGLQEGQGCLHRAGGTGGMGAAVYQLGQK